MICKFNTDLAQQYKSQSQKIRVMTENWVDENSICPICGNLKLTRYENNKPVADFYCSKCNEQYELKSKNGNLGIKIADGAYSTMIERISSNSNPNFFFLGYQNYNVENFIFIPKHFFTPNMIEARKPLADTARRAGWIGCNINIKNIPESGKIYLIKNGEKIKTDIILNHYNLIKPLVTKNIDARGWLMDVLICIDKIKNRTFSLQDIYAFENELKIKHPNNNFIKDKIRQQLQYLRDRGFIDFKSRGMYEKNK